MTKRIVYRTDYTRVCEFYDRSNLFRIYRCIRYLHIVQNGQHENRNIEKNLFLEKKNFIDIIVESVMIKGVHDRKNPE